MGKLIQIPYGIPIPHFGNNLEYKSEKQKEREFYEERLRELEEGQETDD